MASGSKKAGNAAEIDRLALAFAKDPGSKVFILWQKSTAKPACGKRRLLFLKMG